MEPSSVATSRYANPYPGVTPTNLSSLTAHLDILLKKKKKKENLLRCGAKAM
jgi:hypothetical protein